MLCDGPARHFLLRDRKGSLDVGADADIVVAEPGRFTFDASKSLSAVQWSSFDGREMRIRVGATFVRGQLAYDGEKIVNRAGRGRFLRPQVGAGARRVGDGEAGADAAARAADTRAGNTGQAR